MKKRTFIATIAVAIIAGVSIFVACTKEENANRNFLTKSISDHLTPTPEFPDNPYDSVGVRHNQLIAPAYQSIVNYGQWDVPMAITFANNTLAFYNYDTTYCRNWANMVLNDYEFLSTAEEMPEEFSPYSIYLSGASDNVVYILDTLFHGIYGMVGQSIIDYVAYKTRIMQCEVTVMGKDNLSDIEKLELLSSMSVLRHSIYFWKEIDPDYPDLQESDKPRKWYDFVILGLADAAGVVGGAVAGAAAGTPLGPGAAIAGGVAGGITGGIAASNGAATLINNYRGGGNNGNGSGNGSGNGNEGGNGGGDGNGDGNGGGNEGGNEGGNGGGNPDGGNN
ncbi:MAG: hypothetical protein IJQ89_00820 [Bacteroidales bacterium]|nr:hypothetical protein [Bacteroidales bacterium]